MKLLTALSLATAVLLTAAAFGQSCPNSCQAALGQDLTALVPGGAVTDGDQPAPPPGPPSEGEQGGRGDRGQWQINPARIIDRLDADENGTLEVSELPDNERGQLLAGFDADEDGVLTVDEIAAHMSELVPRPASPEATSQGGPGRRMMTPESLIERLDIDGNGTLEISELPEGERGERMAAADTDGDGTITVEELTAYLEARRAEGGPMGRGQREGRPQGPQGPQGPQN